MAAAREQFPNVSEDELRQLVQEAQEAAEAGSDDDNDDDDDDDDVIENDDDDDNEEFIDQFENVEHMVAQVIIRSFLFFLYLIFSTTTNRCVLKTMVIGMTTTSILALKSTTKTKSSLTRNSNSFS
jgi:hypothetical protein